jgi:N-acetyl-gamma-glutamyl-phosphate reductase
MDKKIKVSLVGGSGHTGIQLLTLLVNHPNISIENITSKSNFGKKVCEMYPEFLGKLSHKYVEPSLSELKSSDLVFFATPTGVAMNYTKELLAEGIKIIDLGADFRIKNVDIWQKWYEMEHICGDILQNAVYGLPEANRDKIKTASLVANPGCYPTAIQLGLLPLLKNKLIDPMTIIVDAKSGVSGAGRISETKSFIAESAENFKAYKIDGHRHLPEMEENLAILSSVDQVKMIFIPHLTPMIRGIHATMYVDCIKDFDPYLIHNEFYKTEPFIEVMPKSSCPQTKSVEKSNICKISVHKVPDTNKLVILSVIDNLFKGAAGQAIQNMNIMMNWPEESGL